MRQESRIMLLLIVGLALCMLQLWLPAYYLTGDGPCHVYNSQVVHDIWAMCKHAGLLKSFYTLQYQPNPNWLSTIIIALLMYVVNGVVAEKIFLTIYVLLYVTGAVLLLKKMSGKYTYWMLAIFLLVFPLTLSKGFYNFSFSIACYIWMVWSWLRLLEKKSVINASLFLLFTALIFFTHLLAFGMGAFTCAALLVSYTVAVEGGSLSHKLKGYFLKNGLLLFVFLLPFLILLRWFTEKEGGMQLTLQHHFYRVIELVQCKFMVNVTHREDVPALIAGIVLVALFGYSFMKFKRFPPVNKFDGLIIALLFAAFLYLFFPESFLGRLILISMRMQPMILLLMVCCIAYVLPEGRVKNVAGLILFTCFGWLSMARISCQVTAGRAAKDIFSAADHIKPYSVVLPLSFSRNGKDEHGDVIADRNFLFVHAADYLGVSKPLIMLDNYEANMGYFPLTWNEEKNPYHHLSRENSDSLGIEGEPPSADIVAYQQDSGVTIDYILLWCYDSSFLNKSKFRPLYDQIQAEYHITYTSPSKRTVLFEKN